MDLSGTQPLIERRRRVVRAEIGRIAVALFADHGFADVTVDDIARAAGISQRTFFRYFTTKDEVVLDYERRLFDRLADVFASRPASEGPVTALRTAYALTSHVAPEDRPRAVQLGRILHETPALRASARAARTAPEGALIEETARRLRVRSDDIGARTVVAAMCSVAATAWESWVEGGGRGDPSASITSALALVETGLAELDVPQRSRRDTSA